jgi:DNA polymerase I-like protein with 3'-5' exonuclease and polymerase domains/uracil-DNA glycosylase
MIPDDIALFMKTNMPEYNGDLSLFRNRLLDYGLSLPAADLPDLQFYMPGQVMAHAGPFGAQTGPHGKGCRYMFVAVAPAFDDHSRGSHFSGGDVGPSAVLLEAVEHAGFDLQDCYFSTVLRFPRPLNASTYKKGWLRPGWELLKEEVQILRPAVICLLGTEVLQLSQGASASMESYRGRPFQFQTETWHCPALAVQSHFNFLANTAGVGAFVKQLITVRGLINPEGVPVISGTEYPDRDYKILWTPEEVRAEIAAEIARGPQVITVDVETGNDNGRPDDTYLVSFQWSHGKGHARVIPFLVERPEPMIAVEVRATKTEPAHTVELPAFGGSGVDRKSRNDRVSFWGELGPLIWELLKAAGTIGGHAIRGDLKQLRDEFGYPIRELIPKIFCTMQAYHVLEKDEYGLKQLTLRYTDMGAYDAPMQDWVRLNAGKGKLMPAGKEDRFFHGYRDICYRFLLPYACCDVDATWRLIPIFKERLEAPGMEKIKELYYGTLLPLNSPIMDIESTGFVVDQDRAFELSRLYHRKYDELLEDFRKVINWEGSDDTAAFNLNSPHHVPGLLYAPPYKDSEKCERARPPGATALGLTPPWETGKFGLNWEDIVIKGEQNFHKPSCEGKALKSILTSKDISDETRVLLRSFVELKDMKQFVTNFMKAPVHDDLSGPEHAVYGKGLLGCIQSDGRIKTSISTLAETHRWRHKKPNLAQMPKTKEEIIQAIFAAHMTEDDEELILGIDDGAMTVKDGKKTLKIPKVRSIFIAPTLWKIVDADWKSAELWVVGYLSGDKTFLHILATEPDMHAYNAVQIFKLDCAVKDVKKKFPQQRFAIKAVVFGCIYGLGASGLADALSLEFKRHVSQEEAKAIIDGFFNMYPGIKELLDRCAWDVEHLGYVETPFGSRRYFPGFNRVGSTMQAKMKREGGNSKIQGTVAIMLDKASVLLDQFRYDTDVGRTIGWQYCLAVHDAIQLLTPEPYAEITAGILQWCMESVEIPGYGTLKVDIDVGDRWGEGIPWPYKTAS